MKLNRILLAAGSSGSGKTLLTCGLLQALVSRGMSVASFKCGPDYIDPMFHSRVIGTKSRNLDTFFTGEEAVRYLLAQGAKGCELAVMEGVMGYYDGVGGTTPRASAYHLARATDTPVILVVNSRGMSLSLAAYIKGFLEYKRDSRIRGVILNQMSPMLYPRMKALLEEELPVKVLGYVPQVEDCVIESRHLGLVLPQEILDLKEKLRRLGEILEKTLDIPGILELAGEAGELSAPADLSHLDPAFSYRIPRGEKPLRLGLASDEAFCFFYEDNFRLLREMGAELIPFSPLRDGHLPRELDGLLLYGGYPELYGRELEENHSMREEIRTAIGEGLPCLAECGGFMYLHQRMEGMDGRIYQMAGVIPGEVRRTPRLTRFGYVTLSQKCPVFGEASLGELSAHEFHYFDSDNCGDAFVARKPAGNRSWECLLADGNLLAGFPHFYYYGNPSLPKAFLKSCLGQRSRRKRRDL
ncbi:MAG: cobyrinate a,c-diamide synthase [Eubacteriales bacterium]|nr:cobyrinate a,c-diamide synthase [Eubacteriales bacterium]